MLFYMSENLICSRSIINNQEIFTCTQMSPPTTNQTQMPAQMPAQMQIQMPTTNQMPSNNQMDQFTIDIDANDLDLATIENFTIDLNQDNDTNIENFKYNLTFPPRRTKRMPYRNNITTPPVRSSREVVGYSPPNNYRRASTCKRGFHYAFGKCIRDVARFENTDVEYFDLVNNTYVSNNIDGVGNVDGIGDEDDDVVDDAVDDEDDSV